jgi:hypothetical protein
MNTQIKTIKLFLTTIFLTIFLVSPILVMAATPKVELGATESFAVLGGQSVTNTGSSTIGGSLGGNVGVSPGSSITGFPPGVISNGTTHINTAQAIQAQADLTAAYLDAAGRPSSADLSGQDLGGMTLTTGVYTFSSSAQLTGTLTLDAEGDPEAVFIFQIGSTLTTAPSSVVELINGASFCRVFWQVTSSATIQTSSVFVGHVFALTSITAETNSKIQGQLLARNGSVTLDAVTITNGVCAAAPIDDDNGNGIPDTGSLTSRTVYGLILLIVGSSLALISYRRKAR